MRKNLPVIAFILGFLLSAGSAFAADVETSATPDASGTTEELNTTQSNATILETLSTNLSGITRQPLSAVPGVDGRVPREPAMAVPGVDDRALEQTNTTAAAEADDTVAGAVPGVSGPVVAEPAALAATTEPLAQTPVPLSPAPPEEEKAACGPTLLTALALIPLVLKREI